MNNKELKSLNLPTLANNCALWRIEPKLLLSDFEEHVILLDSGKNSEQYFDITPKVQNMGKFTSYWENYWGGSDAVTSPNVKIYFNRLKEVYLIEAGMTRTYYYKGIYDQLFGYSLDFVKQLAELKSLNLNLIAHSLEDPRKLE